jgi:hypothetical protein
MSMLHAFVSVLSTTADPHVISIADATVHGGGVLGFGASCTYSLENDGDIVHGSGAGTDQGDWITPKESFSNYEARATLTSGALSSGTTGSWLNLGTPRSWVCSVPGEGSQSATLTIEIRRVVGGVVLEAPGPSITGLETLRAESLSGRNSARQEPMSCVAAHVAI